MYRKSVVVLLLSVALAGLPLGAQSSDSIATAGNGRPDYTKGAVWWPHFTNSYRRPYVAEIDMANTDRLLRLVRDGNLYLSLEDAVSLALENNLDIAVSRYQPLLADADILRARAGGTLRASGGDPTAGFAQIRLSAASGPPIPQLEPVLVGTLGWAHRSTPLSNTVITGTNTQIQESATNSFVYSQAFLTGSAFTLSYNNATANSNSIRNAFNPSLTSSVALTFRQSLTQGWGRSINSRQLHIARNNREVSDLVFKQQVMDTVTSVANLYWDLVSFTEDVRVKEQSLALSQKLYEDNKRQVEIGTLAPIEIVRAEAEVAARLQDLTISQTQLQQQETVLKNALSKTGVGDPAIAEARVIPTARIDVPAVEAIEPVQDLIASALQARPELAQSRIQLTNSNISLKAVHQAMLPVLDFVGGLTNNALAGQVNDNFSPLGAPSGAGISPFFLGGTGTTLSQIFARNFPDYSLGVQLTVPLRNRTAQADMATAQFQLRQQELKLHQSENQVRVDVRNALIAVQQARARLDASRKARVLQEQTLDAEQKKFALGASTIFLVIQAQRDLASARQLEVAAMNNYIKAHVQLDRSTGQTLIKNNISLAEAYDGRVKRDPNPIPPRQPGE